MFKNATVYTEWQNTRGTRIVALIIYYPKRTPRKTANYCVHKSSIYTLLRGRTEFWKRVSRFVVYM